MLEVAEVWSSVLAELGPAQSQLFLARAAALQSVAVRRLTGNDVVATISAVSFGSSIQPNEVN